MTDPYQAPVASVDGAMSNCKGCTKEIHSQAAVCPHCGLTQRSRSYKNRVLAGALAFLLGAFGVHRFYLGQWWGIFYLLLFWTGIPGLIALIEAIVMWCTNQMNWDKRHNEGRPATPNEQSGAGTIIVVVIAVVFVGIMTLGILAAVAIPAYHDYTIRARVSEALVQTVPVRSQYESFYEETKSAPQSNADLGLENPSLLPSGHELQLTEEGFVITFSEKITELSGKSIEFEPYQGDYRIEWDCTGGDVAERYRPVKCRSERQSRDVEQ